jgi:hypothetical protein
MPYPLLTSKDISTSYYKNSAFGYSLPLLVTTINGEPFVMAKSVVRWLIESNYKYGKDPFINSIEKLCAADIMYFEIKDKEILLKVWDSSGNFPAIIFVKIITLLSRLKEVFPGLSDDSINDISKNLKCLVEKVSN